MYVHVQRLSGSPIYSNSVIFSVFKKKYTYNILWDTINQNKILRHFLSVMHSAISCHCQIIMMLMANSFSGGRYI